MTAAQRVGFPGVLCFSRCWGSCTERLVSEGLLPSRTFRLLLGILIFENKYRFLCSRKFCVMPLCFSERPPSVPAFANCENFQEIFGSGAASLLQAILADERFPRDAGVSNSGRNLYRISSLVQWSVLYRFVPGFLSEFAFPIFVLNAGELLNVH